VGDNEEQIDPGRYRVTGLDKDRGSFLTPSLRDVALTAPYMHDGKLKTLKNVVDFYAGKGNSNPYLDDRIARIELSGQERSDLVEVPEVADGRDAIERRASGKGSVPMKTSRSLASYCLLGWLVGISGCAHRGETTAQSDQKAQEAVVPAFHVDPATAGSISGEIRYTGKRPVGKAIDMSNDPACVEAHHRAAFDESLVVSPNGSLANAFIYVKGARGQAPEVPSAL
jgi:hypothetical protein